MPLPPTFASETASTCHRTLDAEAVAESLTNIALAKDVNFESMGLFGGETEVSPLDEVNALEIKAIELSDQGLGVNKSYASKFVELRYGTIRRWIL